MNKMERVYSTLRERILDGTFSPGYRLVIGQIGDELGVSTLPVREAMRRLEAEGLLVFRPNTGAQVTPADPARYVEGMRVLALLEGYATAAAASRLRPVRLKQLDAETDAMQASMDSLDILGFSDSNRRFHAIFHKECDNPYLAALLTDTERRLDAIRSTVFTHIPRRGLASIADHRNIVAMIRAGAPALEIEVAARCHKLLTIEAFEKWRDEHSQASNGQLQADGTTIAAAEPAAASSGRTGGPARPSKRVKRAG